jgi:abortive infection bacteriophage resistance protein
VIIRNIAAHGARLYNRKLPTRVKYRVSDTGIFDNNTPFAGLYALFNLLPLEEQKLSLKKHLNNLILEYPKTDINELGFPCNWHDVLQE